MLTGRKGQHASAAKKKSRSAKTGSQADTMTPVSSSNPPDPVHEPSSDSDISDGEPSDSVLVQVASITEHAPQGFGSDEWDDEEEDNFADSQVMYLPNVPLQY